MGVSKPHENTMGTQIIVIFHYKHKIQQSQYLGKREIHKSELGKFGTDSRQLPKPPREIVQNGYTFLKSSDDENERIGESESESQNMGIATNEE